MKPIYSLFFSLLIANSSLANSGVAQQKITPDIAVQRVLKKHGLDSKVLRSFDQLEAEAKRSDGLFEFVLTGSPELYVLLDRDYWILKIWSTEKRQKGSSYILNPKDEQSGLNIIVEEGPAKATNLDKSHNPGFTEYSSREGVLAGSRVSWRRCSDSHHLYSDATLTLKPTHEARGSVYTIYVEITANTEARRLALEDCLARLEIRKSEPITKNQNHGE